MFSYCTWISLKHEWVGSKLSTYGLYVWISLMFVVSTLANCRSPEIKGSIFCLICIFSEGLELGPTRINVLAGKKKKRDIAYQLSSWVLQNVIFVYSDDFTFIHLHFMNWYV